jgi:hypothetical protein
MLIQVLESMLNRRGRRPADVCRKCPVAKALTAWLPLPPGYYWSVGTRTASIMSNADESMETIILPQEAQNLIDAYDVGMPLSPISFEI